MFRYAKEEDADQILPILFQIFDEMELDVFKEVGDEKMAQVIKEGFFQPGYRYGLGNILVNEIDGKVVAIMVGYPEALEDNIDAPLIKIMHKYGIKEKNLFDDKEAWPGEWYLDSFAVSPAYQGKGIGTKTMEHFIDVIRDRGEKILSLNVDVTNEPAKHVYDKVGFKKVGQLYIGSHLYDHMQYDLTETKNPED